MVALAPPLLWRVGRAPFFNAASLPSKGAHNGALTASQKQTQKQLLREEKAPALVIVPGWLSESSQYYDMASYLSSKGFKTLGDNLQMTLPLCKSDLDWGGDPGTRRLTADYIVSLGQGSSLGAIRSDQWWHCLLQKRSTRQHAELHMRQIVPLKWYNWIPSLGGRSVRPILDRIDATIARALNRNEEQIQSEDGGLEYTFSDFFKEFINPKNGAQPPKDPSRKRIEVNPLDTSPTKVILVAHSAGGWICRILLGGKVPYDGHTYAASRNVRALATLGTPHVCTDKLTKRNMDFVNENYPGAAEAKQGVHYVCIAGKFARGQAEFGGVWKDFTWQSYELCCGEGDVWGDGVIPLECAIGLEGAHHVILEGVEHFPSIRDKQERKWYGSPEVVDKWFPLLMSLASQGKEEIVESTVS